MSLSRLPRPLRVREGPKPGQGHFLMASLLVAPGEDAILLPASAGGDERSVIWNMATGDDRLLPTTGTPIFFVQNEASCWLVVHRDGNDCAALPWPLEGGKAVAIPLQFDRSSQYGQPLRHISRSGVLATNRGILRAPLSGPPQAWPDQFRLAPLPERDLTP